MSVATRREKEKAGRKRSSARDWAKQQDTGREATCLKLPEGVEFCKLEVGVHKFDFLPFIAGKNNPRADEGMEHFERSYESHYLQTPEGGRPYPCRRACFNGKRCAVCDWLSKHGGSGDPELVKGMRAKPRHLWLINDVTKHTGKGTPPVKYKVLDTGHFNRGTGFGELMQDAINSLDEGIEPFVLEGGFTATLTVKEQSFSGKKYNAVTRIDLRQHSYDYDEEVLAEAPCLDTCIVDVGYDAVKKILEPESVEDEPDETPPPKAKAKPAAKPSKDKDDDDSDDSEEKKPAAKPKKGSTVFKVGDIVEHPEMGECEVKKVSADGTSLKLEDRKGKLYPGIDPDEVTKVETADADDDDEDDEPEEKPAPKPKVGKPAKDIDEDDEEDGDSDDDDEDSDSDDDEEDSDEDDE